MKKQYNFILWDIDDTLIDFKVSEKIALKKCFAAYGVELTDEDVAAYSNINHGYWKLLEQGKIEKKIMLKQRFDDFIAHLSVSGIESHDINQKFQLCVGEHAVMFDHAYEICKQFQGKKKQYAITNGTIIAQKTKLKITGLDKIFDDVFISDEIGYQKPELEFFNHVAEHIPNFKLDEAIVIGDSLSGDIKGANNAGIDCCWVNPKQILCDDSSIKIDYEIKELKQVLDIIK